MIRCVDKGDGDDDGDRCRDLPDSSGDGDDSLLWIPPPDPFWRLDFLYCFRSDGYSIRPTRNPRAQG